MAQKDKTKGATAKIKLLFPEKAYNFKKINQEPSNVKKNFTKNTKKSNNFGRMPAHHIL